MAQNKQLITDFTNQITKYEKGNLTELLATHNITPAQFKNIVINEVKKSEQMQKAFLSNPASLFASILLCAELGLHPSGEIGEFYFIPFGRKITPILGYKGIINLLLRGENIHSIYSEIVYEGDEFEFEYGLEPKLNHMPNLDKRTKNMKFVYAVAKLNNGEKMFKVMSVKEIMDIVKMSKVQNPLYTNSDKDPQGWMFKKTVIKQLAKTLPKDYYGKKGVSMDDKIEGGSYLQLDDDGNIMVVEGRTIKPKRSKGVYDNLMEVETENKSLNIENNDLSLELKS